jgi:hypothetical protein
MKKLLFFLLASLAVLMTVSTADAVRIRVAQESTPGAGDFDKNILGYIEAYFEKEKTAGEFYSYEELAYYSFNGTNPRLRADTSHLFLVTAKEGLTMFIVHDKPNDEDGGVAIMRLKVEGDPNGARILVFDDPYSEWDSFEAQPGGRKFSTWHRWFSCCTDGLVLGSLEGGWKVFLEFPQKDEAAGTETIYGLKFWKAISPDGKHVTMKLEKGRRVRLDPMGPSVKRGLPSNRHRFAGLPSSRLDDIFRRKIR